VICKQRRVYRSYATPWELLQEVPQLSSYLKPGISAAQLQRQADACSDTQAAGAMQEANPTSSRSSLRAA
jgi:hypothetical protein